MKKHIQQELTRISRDKVVDKTKYWALFAVVFYEKLFQKIDNKERLLKAYKKMLKEVPKGQQRDALTFFYRIRRDELDKEFKWENKMKKSELRQIIREEIQKLNEVKKDFDKPVELDDIPEDELEKIAKKSKNVGIFIGNLKVDGYKLKNKFEFSDWYIDYMRTK